MLSLSERIARYEEMQTERDKGRTNAQIADLYKLTRQRIHTILDPASGPPRPNGRPKKQQE